MESNYWHQRWKSSNIAFHQNEANILLVKYFNALSLTKGDRIFVPLCGKTLDIVWLLSMGYSVAGAELSEIAIKQLFDELGAPPTVSTLGNLKKYSAENIDIFVGDIFDLSEGALGTIDAIYDRAALVALPKLMRTKYVSHLTRLVNKSPQLLISYEYNQELTEGPPFSINTEELKDLYEDNYHISLINSSAIEGRFKERLKHNPDAREHMWLLKNK